MKEVDSSDMVRAYLAAIVDSSADAIISKNLDGIITSWNKSAERLLGYSEKEAIGQPISLIIPSEDVGEEEKMIVSLMQGKQIDHYEAIRQTKSGEKVNLSISVSPIIDHAGAIIGISKIARDITQRKRTEERHALFAEAGRILGSSLDYEHTLSAVCQLVVPKFADWCSLDLLTEDKQIKRIEIAHKDPEKIKLAHEYRRRYPHQMNDKSGLMEVLRTGQPQLYPVITDALLVKYAKDETHLRLIRLLGLKSVMIVPLVARDNILGVMSLISAESGYSYDHHDLELALELAARAALAVDNARLFYESQELAAKQQEALKEQRMMQQQLSLLVDASGSLSVSLDLASVLEAILNLSIRMIAADAYAIWRLDTASGHWSIGHSANLSERYRNDAIKVLATASNRLEKPLIAEDVLATERLQERKNIYEHEGILSLMAIPLKIRGLYSGTLVFYYRVKHHFSEIEVSIATALSNLAASAIGTAELYEDLKSNDRKKDEFLAILAHELRNPLAPISNALHLLKSPSVNETIRSEAASLVSKQIDQMTHLLEDLLDIARITRGKIELRLNTLDISEAIKIAVEATKPLMNERRHHVEINLPLTPCIIHGDITRLAQVFTNLLNNAGKYSGHEGHIIVTVCAEEDEILIRIKDNGIGIPAQMLYCIFDMFEQVDSSMERAYGGLGIGLTLVKNIVEMHQGNIRAFSDGKGKGSEFILRLPRVEEVKINQDMKKPMTHDTSPLNSLKILVVDDNDASAKTMGWTLEILGHQIQLAHDGPSALQASLSFIPDVVLLDIGLPGMNGYEVCKEMRRQPLLSHTVFIAQTGWGQQEHLDRSKEAGFSHHLVKPINIDVLKKVLDEISVIHF
ncbi:MAG: PAS domain S-box protein [Pseudomonadota bacterium]